MYTRHFALTVTLTEHKRSRDSICAEGCITVQPMLLDGACKNSCKCTSSTDVRLTQKNNPCNFNTFNRPLQRHA